ncbi:MAG: ABC transporter ATP-binding protein [Synergistaceae bacterium]|jgi:iron complex transport system ATP-binding protein|nr:ABC transporter ATP-binding protein [Synergistaceae bacterium]
MTTKTNFWVRFLGLEAGYGEGFILSELCGTIRPGTLTALIGPNGSGKTTLMRVFSGLLPYSGKLTLGERELSKIPRRELGRVVGVVPQQTRMNAPFTVYEVVTLGRLPHQGTSDEDDGFVLKAVARMELERLLFRDVTRLSGGEAQRVSVAAALAQDPPVMLLDEPASALDPRHTTRLFSLLRELAAEGKTVVATAHDVNLAAAFADFILAMKGGKILFDAPAKELNEAVLERVYDTPFEPYISVAGKRAWHATLSSTRVCPVKPPIARNK